RATGTVGGILPLRDNAFEAKLAGMGEHGHVQKIGGCLKKSNCRTFHCVAIKQPFRYTQPASINVSGICKRANWRLLLRIHVPKIIAHDRLKRRPSSKPSESSIYPDRSAAARTRTPANGIRVNSIHVELPGYRKNYSRVAPRKHVTAQNRTE